MSEICSKLTIKTPEESQRRHPSALIVNFKVILQIVLVFGLFLNQ